VVRPVQNTRRLRVTLKLVEADVPPGSGGHVSHSNSNGPTTRTLHTMKSALKLGATIEEIMEVLKIGVAAGMQACNLSIPILVDELERFEKKEKP
jgi:hypothetical protein